METEQKLSINHGAPQFIADAYNPKSDSFSKISLSDYKGKWVILFFYPADFTFVCPTELEDLALHYKELTKMNSEVLGISTDTKFSHKAWHDSSEAIKKITFPMLSDATGKISQAYNVYIDEEGITHRGTFIINPDGVLKSYEVNEDGIGRSSTELIRKLQAAQFVELHGDQACPANWKPGEDTLKPGVDLVNKI